VRHLKERRRLPARYDRVDKERTKRSTSCTMNMGFTMLRCIRAGLT
jgi:hypothetical protein